MSETRVRSASNEWVKWTLVKNSNDQQFYPHITIKKDPSEYQRRDRIRASTKEEIVFGQVLENTRQMGDQIRASTEEFKTERIVSGRVPEKWLYLGEYRKGVESEGVPKKVEFGWLPENSSGEYRRRVGASTGKGFGEYRRGSGWVPDKGPGEYEKGPGECRKRVQASIEKGSGWILGKGSSKCRERGKIRVSIEKGFGQVPKKSWIRASTGKGRIRASIGKPKKTSQGQQHKEKGCMPQYEHENATK